MLRRILASAGSVLAGGGRLPHRPQHGWARWV